MELSEAKEDLTDTENALSADQAFLQDLKERSARDLGCSHAEKNARPARTCFLGIWTDPQKMFTS